MIKACSIFAVAVLAAACSVAQAQLPTGWTYYEEGNGLLPPDRWHEQYPVCYGQRQSPISLSPDASVQCSHGHPVILYDGDCTLADAVVSPNQSNYGEIGFQHCNAPFIKVGETEYSFSAVHLHSAAEHSLDGHFADAELHLVHRNAADPTDILVVAVLLLQHQHPSAHGTAPDNALLGALLNILSNGKAPVYSNGAVAADMYSLIPPNSQYFTYEGSLTVPPCSETVQWAVMQQPAHISYEQLQQYRGGLAADGGALLSAEGLNARPLQPINGRDVQLCSLY